MKLQREINHKHIRSDEGQPVVPMRRKPRLPHRRWLFLQSHRNLPRIAAF
jgi:hypothetical protein